MNVSTKLFFVSVVLLLINACSTSEVESETALKDIVGSWRMTKVESENNFLAYYDPIDQPAYYVFTDSNLRMITYTCYHLRDVDFQIENDSLFMFVGQKKARFVFNLIEDSLRLSQDGLHGLSTLVFARDDNFKEYNSFREGEAYNVGNCFDGYMFRFTGESKVVGDTIAHQDIRPPDFIDLRPESGADFNWTDNGVLIYRIDSLVWHLAIEDYNGDLIQFRPFNLNKDTNNEEQSFLLSNEVFVYEKQK